MARSTRLFQRAGSPLIQGNSRLHHSIVPAIVVGFIVGVVVPPLFTWALDVAQGDVAKDAFRVALEQWKARAPGLAIGAVCGATLGAVIGRAWGSLRAWLPACLGGAVLGATGAAIYAALVG